MDLIIVGVYLRKERTFIVTQYPYSIKNNSNVLQNNIIVY